MSAMAVQLLAVGCGLSRWTTTTISSSHAMPSLDRAILRCYTFSRVHVSTCIAHRPAQPQRHALLTSSADTDVHEHAHPLYDAAQPQRQRHRTPRRDTRRFGLLRPRFMSPLYGTMPRELAAVSKASGWGGAAVAFLSACARGIAQVMFMNNPVTGVIIAIALFISSP